MALEVVSYQPKYAQIMAKNGLLNPLDTSYYHFMSYARKFYDQTSFSIQGYPNGWAIGIYARGCVWSS